MPAGRDLRLDGIRGIAVLLVLLYHAHLLRGGWLGVDVFFVLSGYLITRLLLAECRETGGIDRRAFYARRVRRLLPALAVLLAVWLLVTLDGWLPMQQLGTSTRGAGWGLALVPVAGAFTLLYNWLLAVDGPTPVGMGHLWTLSVEEQFYLAWPAAMLAASRRGRDVERILLPLVVTWIGVSLLLTVIAAARYRDLAYFSTQTSCLGLLLGAAVALRPPGVGGRLVGVAGLAALGACVLFVPDDDTRLLPWAILVACAATVAQISAGGRLLELSWLRYAGRRSYAIYLWSSPLAYALTVGGGASWLRAVALVAGSFVLAELSWRLVERRFIGRGARLRSARRAPRRGLPAGSAPLLEAAGPAPRSGAARP